MRFQTYLTNYLFGINIDSSLLTAELTDYTTATIMSNKLFLVFAVLCAVMIFTQTEACESDPCDTRCEPSDCQYSCTSTRYKSGYCPDQGGCSCSMNYEDY